MERRRPNLFLGVYGCILILLVSWLLNQTHFFALANNFFYDTFARISPQSIRPEEKSLLISCSYEQGEADDDTWLTLLETLKPLSPAQIVFTFFPRYVSPAFYEYAAQQNNILFGQQIVTPFNTAGLAFLEPLPKQVADSTLKIGLQGMPLAEQGIYRQQQLSHLYQGKQVSSLIRLAAEQRLQTKLSLDESNFLVNFNGRHITTQPQLTLPQALEGNLISTLVEGRTIFIGEDTPSRYPGLLTPLSHEGGPFSFLTYSAYAFDSLYTGRTIQQCGEIIELLLLLIPLVIGLGASQFLNTPMIIINTGIILILTSLLGFLMLAYAQLFLPIMAPMFAQILLLIQVLGRKLMLREQRIQRLLYTTKQQIQEKLLPDDFFNSPQYWAQIVNMVGQTLSLERSIFFETIEGDHRLKPVVATGCSLDDIHEKRRDYFRYPYKKVLKAKGKAGNGGSPYAQALETGTILEVKKFFTTGKEGERQFLVSLRIPGAKLLGFWAFSLMPEQVDDFPRLLQLVTQFANQIAKMLEQRKQWRREQQLRANPVRKLLALEGGEGIFENITDSVHLVSRRLHVLELVFDALGTAAVLYDLFGRVVYANQKVIMLCTTLRISPYKFSAVDLIAHLTKQKNDEVRHIIADIIFSKEEKSFFISDIGPHKDVYRLAIRPLTEKEEGSQVEESQTVNPFNVQGILLEMHEMSGVRRVLRLKEIFFDLSLKFFNRHEASLPPLIEQLQRPTLTTKQRFTLAHVLSTRLRSLFQHLGRLGEMMSQDLLAGELSYLPTDSLECLESCLQTLEFRASSRKIEFYLQAAPDLSPVLSVPDELEAVFAGLLEYLMDEAKPNTMIRITLKETPRNITVELLNAGYGMPNEDFQRYLEGEQAAASTEVRKIRDAAKQIKRYGGTFLAKSEIGRGTRFHIQLNIFRHSHMLAYTES